MQHFGDRGPRGRGIEENKHPMQTNTLFNMWKEKNQRDVMKYGIR